MEMRVENGNLILTDGNDSTLIPLDVLAAWRQLVACADDVEAVAAILAHTDPGMYPDGSTAFTPAYRELDRQALLDRNQESRAARVRAISPMGALVADGRMETRRLLGLSTVRTRPANPTSEPSLCPKTSTPTNSPNCWPSRTPRHSSARARPISSPNSHHDSKENQWIRT